VKFDASFVVHGVLDDTQEALVSTLPNDHSLSDQLVTSETTRRSHGTSSIAVRCIESRVQTAQIRTLCLRTTALSRHGDNVRAAHYKDALVLDEFAVADEKSATMDVDDLALSTFATVFLDIVFMPDLGPVAVGCNGMLVPADNLRYLGVEKCSNIALLVNNAQHFTIYTNNTTDSGSTILC
jgi:hypothetical protein